MRIMRLASTPPPRLRLSKHHARELYEMSVAPYRLYWMMPPFLTFADLRLLYCYGAIDTYSMGTRINSRVEIKIATDIVFNAELMGEWYLVQCARHGTRWPT